ncbi:TonB-dependent receptor [Pandoraea captiosa]|uniref:TonB-dependent receptor n=1 Tax=Pandoraea captiosa TaxID=2508302 RepID=A0A5E4ZXK0_9BURK|nr:TonB-dependent siderophore receptor [Pandoraea captiosa]VVE65497.1 TonB-dependent receptor [Pandoraea captiosa]
MHHPCSTALDRAPAGRCFALGKAALTVVSLFGSAVTFADDTHLPLVNVNAQHARDDAPLSTPTTTGSRLNLSSLDTPASVETLTARQIEARGDQSVNDAVTRTTGLTSTATPGNGGTALAVRGFAGQESVMTLYDGTRLYPGAGTMTFPFDTWQVERIDVLRGPASVLYGEGAIGGVVNVVPKRPQRESATTIQAGFGTDGQKRFALDTTGALGPMLSYRFYVSDNRSNGWVERGDAHTTSVGGAVKLDVSPKLSFTLDYDYARQMPSTYFGVPLNNGTIDTSLRYRNFNVGDALIAYFDQSTRLTGVYRAADGITIRDQLYYLNTNRHWRNSESYEMDPSTRRVTRSDYIEILQHEHQVGNRLDATVERTIAGHANRFVVGVEANQISFQRDSNTPFGGTSAVNADAFDPGVFASPDPTLPEFRTLTRQVALFAEDRFGITPRLSAVGGVRYDYLDYSRRQLATGSEFGKTFSNVGWRLGLVYQLSPSASVYGQYTRGADSIGSLVTLSQSQTRFDLATGEQWEAGLKQELPDARGFWTLAVYQIVKRHLLTTDPLHPTLTQQVGQQSSRGVEVSGALTLGYGLSVEANASLLRARYDNFDESVNGMVVSRNGNVPNNIPQQTANVWLTYTPMRDVVIGTGLRYVGRRYSDNANTAPIPSYTVFDASASWQATRRINLTLYLRNLGNRAYAVTSESPTEWLLGPSRSAQVVATMKF